MDQLLTDAFDALLAAHATPAVVREIEAGGSPAALWAAIEDAGFADALVPEARGGSGLALHDVFGLLLSCGRHALPVPLGTTMVLRAALAEAGREIPKGPLDIADANERPFDLALDERAVGAAVTAALMAGAMERLLSDSLRHANDRKQFGRAIGQFQAIQQQLSVMAEQVYAARMAAEIGCAGTGHAPDPRRAAIAKSRVGEAVAPVTAIAHAVHGAMGIAAETDVGLFTRRLHVWRGAFGSESYWNRRLGQWVIDDPGRDSLALVRDMMGA